ncbi:MAG: NAD(P)/FAD-dependent oxidoreductase [Eubacterium sp.]|jgi:glycerol-3-phosphate dehydrogenase
MRWIRMRAARLRHCCHDRVQVRFDDDVIYLSGELDNWQDIYKAGAYMAKDASRIHVVNDIALKGAPPQTMRKPEHRDSFLEGRKPDVLIIGGGISGCAIARELAKWKLDVLLVDKEADFALQATGRNDGEVHVGVDLSKGSLKQKYVLLGNAMYDRICKELDVPFRRVGQYACFTQGWLKPVISAYAWWRKVHDGVKDVSIVSGKKLLEDNPTFSHDFAFAMYNSSAGIVSPYELCIAYAENAADNGVTISLATAVEGMETEDGKITAVHTSRGTVYPKVVINAAGVFADDIAEMAHDRFYSIHPRRGTDAIQDVKSGPMIHTIASFIDLSREALHAHSKGGGLLKTVHGNVLAGPDAQECREKEDFSTYPESLDRIYAKQKKTIPTVDRRDIITYFTGVRAATYEEDFILEWGRKCTNMYHCAGIQSPGLTSAPAFAVDIAEDVASRLNADKNQDFDPYRKGIPCLKQMDEKQRDEMIKKNPDYGVIVCRCEEVSKGEILDALNRPYCPQTIDAVKKRVRPGMGRCQGGFCMPLVAGIIAEKNHIPLHEVMKSSDRSWLLSGPSKGEADDTD